MKKKMILVARERNRNASASKTEVDTGTKNYKTVERRKKYTHTQNK